MFSDTNLLHSVVRTQLRNLSHVMSAGNNVLNETDNDENPFPDYDLFHGILHILTVYVPAVAIICGTLANVLAAVILGRIHRALQLSSTALYLLVAVIMDAVVIVLCAWDDWLKRFVNIHAAQLSMDASDIVCRLYPFISDSALHLGTWLMVAMTTDTIMMRMYPERAGELLHRERAKSVILILIVLVICVNAQCFWTYALIKMDKTMEKTTKDVCTNVHQGNQQNETFIKLVWPIIDVLVVDVVPLLIVLTCSFTFATRRHRRERVANLQAAWRANGVNVEVAGDVQRAVIIICVAYALVLLPKTIGDVRHFVRLASIVEEPDDEDERPLEYITMAVAEKDLFGRTATLAYYSVLCCKPVVVAASAPLFRQELARLLTFCCKNTSAGRGMMRGNELLGGTANRLVNESVKSAQGNAGCCTTDDGRCDVMKASTSASLIEGGGGGGEGLRAGGGAGGGGRLGGGGRNDKPNLFTVS